jgi:hypothetical protein
MAGLDAGETERIFMRGVPQCAGTLRLWPIKMGERTANQWWFFGKKRRKNAEIANLRRRVFALNTGL